MTRFNSYEHDGFGGLVNSRHNARNWCAITDRVIAERGSTLRIHDPAWTVKATWSAPTYPNAPHSAVFDGLDRVWSAHSGDNKLYCSSRDLGSVLYTSAAFAESAFGFLRGDNDGSCYLTYDGNITPGSFDAQVIKFAGDLSGQAWANTNLTATRSWRLDYVQGLLYHTVLDIASAEFQVRQLDASDGSDILQVDEVECLAVAPDGGFLGRDYSVTPNVCRFYSSLGDAGVELDDLLALAYVTRQGITYGRFNSFGDLWGFDDGGTRIIEIEPEDVSGDSAPSWRINALAVNDCNVPSAGAVGKVFCAGRLEDVDSGLDPYENFTFNVPASSAIASTRDGTSNYMEINGHWPTFT